MYIQSFDWINPLELAACMENAPFVLCLSSSKTHYSGNQSIVAYGVKDTVKAQSFDALQAMLSSDEDMYTNAWFGTLSYELRHDIESLPASKACSTSFPALLMMQFSNIIVFDHKNKTVTAHSEDALEALPKHTQPHTPIATIDALSSNMTKAEYLEAVTTTVAEIHKGNLYQANITRKFSGTFETTANALSIFTALTEASPAPYSALIQLEDKAIISSSPEMFLRIDAQGNIETHPIKGSAARNADATEDNNNFEGLAASEKDRAENLMIVDLMRNDLSHCAEINSVTTGPLFEVTSHATIHHMSTGVHAKKHADKTTLDVVKQSFPPGSMTGAPKVSAMKLCHELEPNERGIYSGALGWFGGDGSCNLSVVIRTLLLEDNRIEFQVGGGIVADSNPEKEWQETMDKALGICKALGISIETIKQL